MYSVSDTVSLLSEANYCFCRYLARVTSLEEEEEDPDDLPGTPPE